MEVVGSSFFKLLYTPYFESMIVGAHVPITTSGQQFASYDDFGLVVKFVTQSLQVFIQMTTSSIVLRNFDPSPVRGPIGTAINTQIAPFETIGPNCGETHGPVEILTLVLDEFVICQCGNLLDHWFL